MYVLVWRIKICGYGGRKTSYVVLTRYTLLNESVYNGKGSSERPVDGDNVVVRLVLAVQAGQEDKLTEN